jgi:hypothetical protein
MAEGHAELALVEFCYDWDWTRSGQEFGRTIELNPNYATAHQWYSYYLSAMARFPEAVDGAGKAQQIDPLSVDHYHRGGTLSRAASACSKHHYVSAFDLAASRRCWRPEQRIPLTGQSLCPAGKSDGVSKRHAADGPIARRPTCC